MGSLLKTLLGRALPVRGEPREARIELGAFGKHPGWDDHIQDPELVGEQLEPLRRALYLEGIGGAIDSGLWANLADGERLEDFNHVFVWFTPGSIYLGRLWSSTDGKGRSRYPMVVCAWCSGLPLPWLLGHVLPVLEELEGRCKATTASDDVRVAIIGTRQRLRQMAAGMEPVAEPFAANPRALAEIADQPGMGPDRQGIHRVQYLIAREMAAYANHPLAETAGTRGISFRAQHIRVPDCAPSKDEALLLWLGFFLDQLDPSSPMLIFLPLDRPWVDLVVGEPDVQQFLCVKASRKVVPLASEIPYNLDVAHVARFEEQIVESRRGAPSQAPRRKPAARPKAAKPAPQPGAPGRSPLRFLRYLWPLLLLAAIAAGVTLFPRALDVSQEQRDPEPAELAPERAEHWRQLCLHTHYWFARFCDKLNGPRRQRWLADPALRGAMEKLIEAEASGRELDPRRLAGLAGGDLRRLATAPPRKAAERSAEADAALDIARGIAEAYLAKLQAQRDRWQREGWTGPAELLGTAIKPVAGLELDPVAGKMMARLFDLDRRGVLDLIEQRTATLREARAAARLLGEEAGGRVEEQVRSLIADADDIPSLLARLDKAAASLEHVAVAGRDMQELRRRIEETGGTALGSTFERCVRSTVTTASDLAEVGAALNGVKEKATAIAGQLGAARDASRSVTRLAGEKAGARLWELAVEPARKANDFAAFAAAIADAHKAIETIDSRLKTLPQAGEALAALGDAARALHDQCVRQAAEGGETLEQLAERIDAAGRTSAAASEAAKAVADIQKSFEQVGDPILAQFQGYVRTEAAKAKDLAALTATLQEAAAAAAEAAKVVRSDWKDRIDRERFQKESTVHKGFQGQLTAQVLADWAREARGYVRLRPEDDPRRDPAYWKEALDDLRWRVAILGGHSDPAKQALGAACARELAALEREIGEGRDLAWTTVNGEKIGQLAADCRKRHEALRARLQDVVEPPEEWLPRVRQLASASGSAALNAVWAKRRDEILPAKIQAADLRTPAGRYEKRWAAIRRLQALLAELDDADALPRGLPEVPGVPDDSPTRRALVRRIEAEREKVLAQAASRVPWQVDDAVPLPGKPAPWGREAADYRALRGDAAKLLGGLGRVERLLDAGYLPADAPSDGEATMAQTYAACRDHPLFKELRAAAAIPVAERVAALEKLLASGREQLVARAQARTKDDPPEILLGLWRRLGESGDWPATAAELQLEAGFRAEVRALAAKVKERDEAQSRALLVAVEREGSKRWETVFNGLAAAAKPDVLANEAIGKLIDVRGEFGVRDAALQPMTRLRIQVHGLRETAASLTQDAPKADVDKMAKAFVTEAIGLPKAIVARTDVTRLLGRLNMLATEEASDDPAASLKKAGPASCIFASQWKVRAYDEGRAVVFTWDGTEHVLKFIRIQPKGGAACYLCTTEASVGLLVDSFKVTGKWAEAAGLLHAFEDTARPKGPRTWEWKGRNTKVVAVAQEWMYKGPEGPPPTPRHPVNYVSAGGALYLASLLGCRLPTVSEWRAAYDEHADPQRNLRDATWRRQLEAVREWAENHPALRPVWPDQDIFWPPGVQGRRGAEAAVVSNGSDDVLWLAPVGNGAVFRHLVGNVAELVRTDETDVHKEAEAMRSWERADFPNLDNRRIASFRVVGGSALSPPELWDGRTKPFHTPWPVDQDVLWQGYSDVGFRLAFTAPRETPADKLKRILADAGYLTP